MTKLENFVNNLSHRLHDLDLEKPFGQYTVELHTPFGYHPAYADVGDECFAIDIYLHAPDPETKEDCSAVSWGAILVFANEDCTKFAPMYRPCFRETFSYSEDDHGDVLCIDLLNLLFKPEFIDFINDMSKEFIEKLQAEVAKL
jgi:hypothetical protein